MTDWTLVSLAQAIRGRTISPVEATRACLDRIAKHDGAIRSFITLDAEGALVAARALEADATAGRWRGPLHGVPLAYKDLCHVHGLATSCGTRTAEYFTSDQECTIVTRLRNAGAITLGKLNMTELALGPFGDNAHHGDVQNPWRRGHVSGGSSSGSGAAVAAGFAAGALGSDTGGSIRLPAAACGIVGLKPTYARVSRAGAMALSWSLDHLGPMTRTVRDAAVMLGIIAGHDGRDGTTSRRAVPDYAAGLDDGIAGLRVGVPDNYYFDGVTADVETAVREAARAIEALGASLRPITLPDPAILHGIGNVIARAESSVIHERLARERPHELQPAVRARLEVGFHISAHDYLQATRLRARLTRQFIDEILADVDIVLTPTIPEPAPALEATKAGPVEEFVRRMGRFSRLTRPFNVLGLPALSVPCGFSGDGRPLALQIVGRPFDEATVLRVGHAYEGATDWHTRRPALE
jgi:aspartyl-tRNA(Asn)/glutamyl-tRNA(Gln) amidotransferase subunit A